MPAHLEPASWILRAGPDMQHHGDPYKVSALVLPVEPGVARVVAASGKLYPGFRRDVYQLAQQMGLNKVLWERSKQGRMTTTIMEIDNGHS